jgi:hypothetical protein
MNALATTKGYNAKDISDAYHADIDRRKQMKSDLPINNVGGQLVGASAFRAGLAAKFAAVHG